MLQKEALVSEVLKAGEGLRGSGVVRVSVRWHDTSSNCWVAVEPGAEYVLFVQKRVHVAFVSMCNAPVTPAEDPEDVLRQWRAAG
jgi:hypothetical protein